MKLFNLARIQSSICLHEYSTVQTFNSCTSRPDVCHCLVVQIPIDNMSKNNPSTSMTHVACESKLRSVVRSFIHDHETGLQSDVRSCIMLGLPTHLVQELNVVTVRSGTTGRHVLSFQAHHRRNRHLHVEQSLEQCLL